MILQHAKSLKRWNLNPTANPLCESRLSQTRQQPQRTLTFAHREFIIGVDLHVMWISICTCIKSNNNISQVKAKLNSEEDLMKGSSQK